MATQIIDNFQLNVAKPIDSRMVTNGTASRNSLAYIYEGLRVYDLVNRAPFVYIGGSWQQESSSGGLSVGGGGGGGSVPAGTQNRLLKYTNSTTVGNSTIVDKGTYQIPNVGIGIDPDNGVALHVNGILKSTSLKGSINGVFVDTGTIDNTKIQPGTDGYALKTINGQVVWTISDALNTDIVIANQTSNSNTHYLLFADKSVSTTGTRIYANNFNTSRLIGIKPDTSQILASGDTSNNESQPTYSFSGTTNAGLYGNVDVVGLSFGGKGLLKLNATKLSIYDTGNNEVLKTGTNKVIFTTGDFTTLNVTGTATVKDLTITGITTFSGTINTTTLNVTGTATLKNLVVTGTTTFTTISTGTLNVTGLSTLGDIEVTGTSLMESVSLSGTLNVTGQSTLKNLVFNGTVTFNGPIQGPMNVSSSLTLSGNLKIGTSYYINSDGTAILQSLNTTDPQGRSNDVTYGGYVTCNKIRIKPTSSQVPGSFNVTGYSVGDIIFVLDTNSTTDGKFYFNQGPFRKDPGGGWTSLSPQ